MIFLHTDTADVPAWTVLVRGLWYVLHPTNEHPGGPVLFTSAAAAETFLAWQEGRGMGVPEAEIHALDGTLAQAVEHWRRLFAGLGAEPLYYSVCLVDPRPPVHPVQQLDATAIPFDPVLLPAGVQA